MERYLSEIASSVESLALAVAVILIAVLLKRVFFRALARREEGEASAMRVALRRHLGRPTTLAFPLLGILLVWPLLDVPVEVAATMRQCILLAIVVTCGWMAVAAINVIGDVVIASHRTDSTDNLDARRVQTQTQVLRRIAIVVTVILTAILLLMSIPGARDIGVSLFASAGVAGLVIGLAARPTLSNIIAGIQIALTQPIRIDDVVIVEGEWGWIEEIRTTYVVVRIWDLRRLIVPLTNFIEKPFQNWTRTTADILGSIFLQVDYTVPVETIREELRRIADASGLWDGKVCVLHVTEARERTLELRALLSAPDSPRAWELRCHVREKLIAFIQAKYPETLPRFRAEFEAPPIAA